MSNLTETLHAAPPNDTVNAEQLEVTEGTANTDFVLTPGGTGAVIFGHEPDNAATGGNKRGAGAVDLASLIGRNAATKVASGANAFAAGLNCTASGQVSVAAGNDSIASGHNSVAIGYSNSATTDYAIALGIGGAASGVASCALGRGTASGVYAVAIGGSGNAATASGDYSFAFGGRSLADRYGIYVHAADGFAANGDAQHLMSAVLRNKTTNASATELFLDGSATRLTIPSGKILHAIVNILGTKSDGTAVARYLRQVTIKNVAGTTAMVGNVITLGTDEAASTSIAIAADDTNDALAITVTGIAEQTWRWVAVVEGVEVAYGT